MSRKNIFRVGFFVNSSRVFQDGTSPIFISITIDGERVKTTMQQRIAHSDWDAKRGLPRPIARTQQITSFLAMMRTKANQAFIDLSRTYETVTAIMVR